MLDLIDVFQCVEKDSNVKRNKNFDHFNDQRCRSGETNNTLKSLAVKIKYQIIKKI